MRMSAAERTPNEPTPCGEAEPLRDVSTAATEFDLDEELNVVAGHLNALHARLVDLAVVMLADPRAWRGPGVHTPELFLAWRTGLSAQRARQIVAIAERVHELPVCHRRVPSR